jgi:hypothetical protein
MPPASRFAVAHLDDLEEVPGPGTLTWRPVRAHFDLRAFGCNAYTAAEAGEDVVEPHDEAGDPGHEELYFVHAGRARFTLDGEEIDAPAGTYVFVRDPAVYRHAVAEEPGTTVLSFGGPPVFAPSGWEWSFRAAPLVESDPGRAREILAEGRAARPDSASIRWGLARVAALDGNREAALARAREALELVGDDQREELLADMRDDAALVELREDL